MSDSRIIGAVEVGTTKTVVLIAEILKPGSMNIIGFGETTTRGVQKGEIIDLTAACGCVHAAMIHAENQARVKVRDVYISQTGGHLDGFFNRGSVTVTRADNIVSRSDIERVIHEVKTKELPPDRVRIHNIHQGFLLDGVPVEDPFGMEGENLQVGYWIVHADERKVRNLVNTVHTFGQNVEDLIVSSMASASVVASDADKQNGCLVLDIGGGTTDYVLYKDRRVVLTGCLPVAGAHLTNDLSLGLRVDRKRAERIKRAHSRAVLPVAEQNEKVWLQGDRMIGDRQIPLKAIHKITTLRLEELFRVIRKILGEHYSTKEMNGGVILTGGTANMPGIEAIAARELGVDARIAEAPQWVGPGLAGPEYSNVLGLLHFAMGAQDRKQPEKRKPKGLLGRILNI